MRKVLCKGKEGKLSLKKAEKVEKEDFMKTTAEHQRKTEKSCFLLKFDLILNEEQSKPLPDLDTFSSELG